jgi:hypothetical protein
VAQGLAAARPDEIALAHLPSKMKYSSVARRNKLLGASFVPSALEQNFLMAVPFFCTRGARILVGKRQPKRPTDENMQRIVTDRRSMMNYNYID